MAEPTAKTVRTETEKAALQLLRERANLVGDAATARHERDQLADAFNEAKARYAERYAAAVQGGWTSDELARLGLHAPESGPARRRRSSRATSSVAEGPVDVGAQG